MTGPEQFFRFLRRSLAPLGFAALLVASSLSPAAPLWAEEKNKPRATSTTDAKHPVKEYTRNHPKTGLPVRVRSYFRRVVEPKAVAVRSYFHHGKRVKGYERRRPWHRQPKNENSSEKGKAPPPEEKRL